MHAQSAESLNTLKLRKLLPSKIDVILPLASDLGLAGCIEHVWRDTIVYLDDKDPISVGRAYGRVSRHLLHEELLKRYDIFSFRLANANCKFFPSKNFLMFN